MAGFCEGLSAAMYRWGKVNRRSHHCCIISASGAMVRYLIRVGETAATASQLLNTLRESPRVDFWPDSISYTEAALEHVTGHRQVTDAYLASLAASHQARLATLDVALATALSATVDLIP